jgi:uncharacterized protein
MEPASTNSNDHPQTVPRRDEVLAILDAHRHILHEMGVSRLALFGSVVRGEAHANSDIDLLIELSRPMGLLAFVGIQQYLEEALGRRVDLVTPDSLHPRLRDRILNEAVHAA